MHGMITSKVKKMHGTHVDGMMVQEENLVVVGIIRQNYLDSTQKTTIIQMN